MAEKVVKATRESFGEALCELAKTNKDIVVLDADLAAATKTSIFQIGQKMYFLDDTPFSGKCYSCKTCRPL